MDFSKVFTSLNPNKLTSGFHGLHCLLPESQVPKNLDPETFGGRAHIGMNIKSFSGRFRRVFDPSAQKGPWDLSQELKLLHNSDSGIFGLPGALLPLKPRARS